MPLRAELLTLSVRKFCFPITSLKIFRNRTWQSAIACYDPNVGLEPNRRRIEVIFREEEAVMLVLSRKEGEEIVINERMTIRIVKVQGGGCRLAFDCPPTDRIRRAELPPFVEDTVQKTAAAIGLPR